MPQDLKNAAMDWLCCVHNHANDSAIGSQRLIPEKSTALRSPKRHTSVADVYTLDDVWPFM